ncbi:MAG: sigma-70 family RNA polymerase sigma factor [Burkholderiales bacterium]
MTARHSDDTGRDPAIATIAHQLGDFLQRFESGVRCGEIAEGNAMVDRIWRLLQDHVPSVQRYARLLARNRTEAEDLAQECLARAVSRAHVWHDVRNVRSYLLTILRNIHVDRTARNVAEVPLEHDGADGALACPPPQLASLELRDLRRGLARLPAEQRRIVLLIGLAGLSYEATARAVGVPVGTVMSRLARGRSTLRELVDGVPANDRELPRLPAE